ncbi:hypothetical protein PFISCL1PPCAC_21037, partial [Pristionchus fissidentatus]
SPHRMRSLLLLLLLYSIPPSLQNAESSTTSPPAESSTIGYTVAAVLCFVIAIVLAIVVGFVICKRMGCNAKTIKKKLSVKENKKAEERTGGTQPTSQDHAGPPTPIPNKFRIPATDIKFKGPLKMQRRYQGESDHDFDGKEDGGRKRPDKIVFDPALNEAVEIGEGVEVYEKSKHDEPKSGLSVSHGGDLLENVPLPEEDKTQKEDKKDAFYV